LARLSRRLALKLAVALFAAAFTAGAPGPAHAQPSNDNFDNRVGLITSYVGMAFGSNVGATTEAGEPYHASGVGVASIWYQWIAPEDGYYRFDTCSSDFATALAVYTGGAVNALTEVASNSHSYYCSPKSEVVFRATAGTAYNIAVGGVVFFEGGLQTGNVVLTWTFAGPRNDPFHSAWPISGGFSGVDGSNYGATREPGEPYHAGHSEGASVWYRWTAPDNGDVSFSTCGPDTNFDTMLAVYTGGPVNALTEVASNDDDHTTCEDRLKSTVNFRARRGTIYSLAVDGYTGATGNFHLSWRLSPSTPSAAPPADFDGDGDTDLSVYRPSNRYWFVNGGALTQYGTSGDIPVPGDYDGDGDTDIAVFRPSNGYWFVNGGALTQYGTSGDIPVPGDYDGDGDTDIAVFRPSNGYWFVRGGPTVAFGTSGDIPVPGDYDGDGDTDVAVFRPSGGYWFVRGGPTVQFGTSGDIPVPGDYDGNGSTSFAVFRPSSGYWFVQGGPTVAFGTSGDRPLPLPSAIRQVFFP
jgi:putative transposon-encoded protein